MASDSFDLAQVFSDCGVPPPIAVGIVSSGWDVEKFALGFKSDSEFDVPEVLQELGIDDELPRIQRASLKQAWNKCVNHCKSESVHPPDGFSGPAATVPGSHSHDASEGSWSEAFAPKLGGPVIAAMKKKFATSYPSEPLTPETMPSNRLIALVHQCITKSHWKWIPWKFRMSLHREDESQSSRASKVPKLENLQLHNILMDEVPSLEISNTSMGLHALRVSFDVYNNAVALCEGAHLANLKAYSMKSMSLLTTKYDAESGLRSPTITEAQSADKLIAGIMMELINDRNWTHDQALHEMTHMRSELSMFLQPRPRLNKPIPSPWEKGGKKGGFDKGGKYQKGSGKSKTKDKGKGKGKTTWVSEILVNGEWKSLCLRYQSGKCSFPDCRFIHACAYPKGDGTACGGKHTAMEHSTTPH